MPAILAFALSSTLRLPPQTFKLIQCFSLLLLGAALSTLATLNFSQALFVGLLASPLSFVRPFSPPRTWPLAVKVVLGVLSVAVMIATSPPAALHVLGLVTGKSFDEVIAAAAWAWRVERWLHRVRSPPQHVQTRIKTFESKETLKKPLSPSFLTTSNHISFLGVFFFFPSHLRQDLLFELLELVLVTLLLRPADAQPLLLIRLRDHMEVHMIDHLMSNPSIVLQDVVVGSLVTVAQRVNVEESEYFVAFEEFHRGDLAYDGVRSCFSRSFAREEHCTLDDLAEDAGSRHDW
ncbi:hypothetical protein KCV07_g8, partial [Aureobasidium melanogenum]